MYMNRPTPRSTLRSLRRHCRRYAYTNAAQVDQLLSPIKSGPLPRFTRNLGFFVATSSAAVLAAAYLTNQDTTKREKKLIRQYEATSLRERLSPSAMLSRWKEDWPTSRDLALDRKKELHQRLVSIIQAYAHDTRGFFNRLAIISAESWLNKSEAQRTCLLLIGLQAGVFAMWQFRRLHPFMSRHFLSSPLSNRLYTGLTSTFSHSSLIHFGFNSLAFYSIGSAAHSWMFTEQIQGELKSSTSRYEFLAFFVAGGLASALGSQAYTLLYRIPSIIRSGRTLVKRDVLPSLGASGAIYSCFSITAMAFPSASVSLIFLPFVSLPIGFGYAGLVAVDVIGLIRGWKLFDHAAHLSGAAFGLVYFWLGSTGFTHLRKFLPNSRVEVVTV